MTNNKSKNKFIRLLNYSGSYKYLTILGCILSALSAISLLIPFIYIWEVVNALLQVAPDFAKAQNLENYAFSAFFYAVLGIALNFCGLMCTHLSAFKNEKNMKDAAMNHLLKLPLGYFSTHTSGGLRKVIDFSTAKTEGFLAHNLFDLVGAIVTPIVFLILLFSFDWRLGLVCLIPIILCFIFMYPMFSKESQNLMVQYQEYLEKMNGEAVEYVRGIPVTKAFQQSVYSFKNFITAIRNYGKFSSEYSLSTQLPMTAFTVSINGFFALLIPAGILLAGLSGALPGTDSSVKLPLSAFSFVFRANSFRKTMSFSSGLFSATCGSIECCAMAAQPAITVKPCFSHTAFISARALSYARLPYTAIITAFAPLALIFAILSTAQPGTLPP